MSGGVPVEIETSAANHFMPTADDLKPHIGDATLIALCSPLNPTGTTFSKEALTSVCELVVEENARRAGKQKPVYLLYDQLYWTLTYGETMHHDPVSLVPGSDLIRFILTACRKPLPLPVCVWAGRQDHRISSQRCGPYFHISVRGAPNLSRWQRLHFWKMTRPYRAIWKRIKQHFIKDWKDSTGTFST